MTPELTVVMYHYVRDSARSPFPALKALPTVAFREQVRHLQATYEMATLESALAFLTGRYRPQRSLCLLTFDDGLKEHATEVTPCLAEVGVQGVFLIVTGCVEQTVATVHKNHVLLAALGLEQYRRLFLERLNHISPSTRVDVDPARAQAYYRFDDPDVARFKYLVSVGVSNELRAEILDHVFSQVFGDERAFARDLYMTWDEARAIQRAGMAIGGHAHLHPVLRGLPAAAQREEITLCADALRRELAPQAAWPFSYPYGEYDALTREQVKLLGFDCAFATEVGSNDVSHDLFSLRRIDTNDVVSMTRPACAQ